MHRHNFLKFRAFIYTHCETASLEFIQREWELYKINNLSADMHDVTCLYVTTFGHW